MIVMEEKQTPARTASAGQPRTSKKKKPINEFEYDTSEAAATLSSNVKVNGVSASATSRNGSSVRKNLNGVMGTPGDSPVKSEMDGYNMNLNTFKGHAYGKGKGKSQGGKFGNFQQFNHFNPSQYNQFGQMMSSGKSEAYLGGKGVKGKGKSSNSNIKNTATSKRQGPTTGLPEKVVITNSAGVVTNTFDLVGTWRDSLGHIVTVEHNGSGKFVCRLEREGSNRPAKIINCKKDATGVWVCGNAVMDTECSNASLVVWVANLARRSVWTRAENP